MRAEKVRGAGRYGVTNEKHIAKGNVFFVDTCATRENRTLACCLGSNHSTTKLWSRYACARMHGTLQCIQVNLHMQYGQASNNIQHPYLPLLPHGKGIFGWEECFLH
jgi:hypothetical protein